MILDKLLEKKDVEAYLEFRRDFLKSVLVSTLREVKPEERGYIEERFKGRISELNLLIDTIRKDTVKDSSKWYYRRVYKNDEVEE